MASNEITIKLVSKRLGLHAHTVRDSVRDLAQFLDKEDKKRLKEFAPRLRF